MYFQREGRAVNFRTLAAVSGKEVTPWLSHWHAFPRTALYDGDKRVLSNLRSR